MKEKKKGNHLYMNFFFQWQGNILLNRRKEVEQGQAETAVGD